MLNIIKGRIKYIYRILRELEGRGGGSNTKREGTTIADRSNETENDLVVH